MAKYGNTCLFGLLVLICVALKHVASQDDITQPDEPPHAPGFRTCQASEVCYAEHTLYNIAANTYDNSVSASPCSCQEYRDCGADDSRIEYLEINNTVHSIDFTLKYCDAVMTSRRQCQNGEVTLSLRQPAAALYDVVGGDVNCTCNGTLTYMENNLAGDEVFSCTLPKETQPESTVKPQETQPEPSVQDGATNMTIQGNDTSVNGTAYNMTTPGDYTYLQIHVQLSYD